MKKSKTNRGFGLIEFTDLYGAKCSIQESSLATDTALWIGIDDAEPKIMASKAKLAGVQTNETCGWVPYPIPEDVFLSTRMHLNKKQVKDLVKVLNRWLKSSAL